MSKVTPKSFCFSVVSSGCLVLFSVVEHSIVPTVFYQYPGEVICLHLSG